jgi:hypothetical protein
MATRVASRYVEAFEFSSPKEREKYLKEHPKADPARHTVKQEKKPGKVEAPEEPKAEVKPEEPSGKEHKQPPPEKEPEAKTKELYPAGRKVVDALKGLSKGAQAFLQSSPAGVKKFFQDEGHRRKVLQGLHAAIEKAPRKMAQRLVDTAKEEVHEFKMAGEGIRAAWNGKPLSKHQKKAIKKVAIHMGITVAAAALTATGVAAGLGVVAKSFARQIAMKSVAHVFEHVHVADELRHIVHGIADIAEKFAAQPTPSQVLAAVVMKSVQEELENFSDDDLKTLLESMAKKPLRVKEAATPAPSGPVLADLCEEAETVQKGLRTWIRKFPQVLDQAQREAVGLEDSGLVWQDRFVVYWRGLDNPMEILTDIDDKIEDVYFHATRKAVQDLANQARNGTLDRLIPPKARIEYAFGNPQFRDRPDRKGHIAYEVSRLEEWAKAFENWTEESIGNLHQIARKSRRLV